LIIKIKLLILIYLIKLIFFCLKFKNIFIIIIKMLDPDKVLSEVKLLKQKVSDFNKKTKTVHDREKFNSDMEKEHEYLFENCKTLFTKCLNNDIEMNRLTEMLNMMKQIKSGKKDKETVEKEIGEKLAKQYVQPLVDNLKNKK
tara:strand:+ start:3555 stop:3983 length:429 start_codon:yes stop_codon:yes gene_type:complete